MSEQGRVEQAWRQKTSAWYRILRPPSPVYHNRQEKKIEPRYPLGRWNLYIGGAGNKVPGYINVDLFALPGVDVACTAEQLPFKDRQFTRVECDAVLAAIIHKFGVSVDFLRKFRAESVFRCDYKASKLVEPNRDEARAPSGNSSARRGLYICVGAGSQGTVRWDTDGASVMRRAFVRDKTMPGAPRCDEKFPEPGHRF